MFYWFHKKQEEVFRLKSFQQIFEFDENEWNGRKGFTNWTKCFLITISLKLFCGWITIKIWKEFLKQSSKAFSNKKILQQWFFESEKPLKFCKL